MDKPYIYRRKSDVETVPCSCGSSTRFITRRDTEVANLHVTHITDSRMHYHKRCDEYYYILEGAGTMALGNDTVELEPGVAIFIPKGLPHRGWGDFTAVIFGVPALAHDDEYFAE